MSLKRYDPTFCDVCLEPYTPKNDKQRTCSRTCGQILARVNTWLKRQMA